MGKNNRDAGIDEILMDDISSPDELVKEI